MSRKIPFSLSKEKSFYESLSDWVGDVLYDELPDKGFDCRDEQIFMSFQIEQALKEKNVLLAEAGVGTGKTIAYLLPAVAYARYTGKPALISCADETLIDQLVKEEGDIRKISDALGLDIDVRLAKARSQYLCIKRLEEAVDTVGDDYMYDIDESLPSFVKNTAKSMQEMHPYGERSDYPAISDAEWSAVNFHPAMHCEACDLRNRCGQIIHRKANRETADLLICSHDFFMEHIWTKDSRQRQGHLPLLPDVSMIVFDEGHLLEYSAQRALTYEVQNSTLLDLLERVMVDGVREETLQLMERLVDAHNDFFTLLKKHASGEEERMKIEKVDDLVQVGKETIVLSNALLEEFVFESEMYTIPDYDLKMVEEYLEQYIYSMELFTNRSDAVDWLENRDGEWTLVIMPRLVTDILKENLFTRKMPIIFSSATLSVGKDFSYLKDSLGIDDFSSFSVESPFDYEEVMEICAAAISPEEKAERTQEMLKSGEQTLILFNSERSMNEFRASLLEEPEGIAFEGDRELSSVIREFQQKKINVLCSYHLWEGLDIPNDSLTRVIIYDLPFPPHDPLFEARRNHAADPFREVDLPFMLLRLRQGAGRLIRTSEDYGTVHVFMEPGQSELLPEIEKVFPVKVELTV